MYLRLVSEQNTGWWTFPTTEWQAECGVGDLHSLEGKELADKYHALYVTALKDLYEQHKDLYALDRASSLKLVE